MEVVIAIIGSGALSALISGIFGLVQSRKNRQKQIEEELQEIQQAQHIAEKDALRTQLLLLIADYPEETSDILRLAEHYFRDLEGNWVLTTIFNRWMEGHKIVQPEWFKR